MTAVAAAKDAGLFAELRRSARALLFIARNQPLAVLGAICGAALVPTCVVLTPWVMGRALWGARDAFGRRSADLQPSALPLVYAYLVIPVGALTALSVTSSIAFTPESSLPAPIEAQMKLVALLCTTTAVTGGLLALIAGATFRALGAEDLISALQNGLGDAVRVGLGRRALAGAVIALVTTALPIVLARQIHDPWTEISRVLAYYGLVSIGQGVGLVWMLALGAPPDDGHGTSSLQASRVVGRLLALAAPVVVILGAALIFAAVRPSPAHSVPTIEERRTSTVIEGSAILPGERGLVVRVVPSGFSIEAADGGGAGEVNAEWRSDIVGVARYAPALDGGWIVFDDETLIAPRDEPMRRSRGVRFDARGVRTDDGIVDRIRWRFGEVGVLLLLASLLLAVPFLVALARGIGSAATLDRGEAGGDYTAWSGALELDAECEPVVVGGRLTAVDGARLVRDASDGVVALAPGALVLGPDGPLAAGTRVSVVARSNRLATLGPRTGSVAWPKDAWLVVGSLDAAKDRIVRTSLRTAAVFGVPSALAALVACVASLLSS